MGEQLNFHAKVQNFHVQKKEKNIRTSNIEDVSTQNRSQKSTPSIGFRLLRSSATKSQTDTKFRLPEFKLSDFESYQKFVDNCKNIIDCYYNSVIININRNY